MHNAKNVKSCYHGIPKNRTCFFCADSGFYFFEDSFVYAKIYKRSGHVSFELAFELVKRIRKWKRASKEIILEPYFKEVEKIKRFEWGLNSLKKAYYVAREFPDLIKRDKRILSFSAYKEIVSAKLSPIEKQEVRAIAEKEKLTSNAIRKLIKKKYQNKEVIENEYKTEIVSYTEDDFVEEVRNFIRENEILKKSSTVVLQVKIKKEKK